MKEKGQSSFMFSHLRKEWEKIKIQWGQNLEWDQEKKRKLWKLWALEKALRDVNNKLCIQDYIQTRNYTYKNEKTYPQMNS